MGSLNLSADAQCFSARCCTPRRYMEQEVVVSEWTDFVHHQLPVVWTGINGKLFDCFPSAARTRCRVYVGTRESDYYPSVPFTGAREGAGHYRLDRLVGSEQRTNSRRSADWFVELACDFLGQCADWSNCQRSDRL